MSTLLSNGLKMPIVGYALILAYNFILLIYSYRFGTYLCKPELVYDSVLSALHIGYRHIDTAEYYANEVQVGQAIKAFTGDVKNDTKR